jgi:hypothetical protein
MNNPFTSVYNKFGETISGFGVGGWPQPGAALDLDFVNNRVKGAASLAAALTVTRASTAWTKASNGTYVEFAINTLRRSFEGALIEEARTNSIRNNSMQGVVAGTPGTAPTNWLISNLGTLTRQIVGSGTENGMDYVDIKISGTSSTTEVTIYPESILQVAGLSGQTWTASLFAKVVAGSLANIGQSEVYVLGYTAGGALSEAQAAAFTLPTTGNLSDCRFSKTYALAGGTTAFVSTRFDLNCTSGTAIDVTLRLSWPQLEQGAFVTSPIRTTAAAATRAADVIVVNSPTSFVSFTQGSVSAEWTDPGPLGTDHRVVSVRADANNSFRISMRSTNLAEYIVTSGGVSQASLVSVNAVVANTRYKAAARWGVNDFNVRFSPSLGADPAPDVSGAVPVGTPVIGVGQSAAGGNQLNGFLRRLTFYKHKLTDAQLGALAA